MATNPIVVPISADTSRLRSGMSEATSITTAELAIMKEQYRQASTDIRRSINVIVDAEKQAAEASAVGSAALAASLQSAANAQRSAIEPVIAKHIELKAAIDAASGSAERAIPSWLAASAAFQVLEGRLPIRAVDRLAASIPGLGSALQLAFPIFGAIAFGEILAKIVEKVIEWKEGLEHIKELNESVGQQLETQSQQYIDHAKHLQQVQIELLGVTQGKASQEAAKYGILSQGLAKDNAQMDALQSKLTRLQATIAAQSVPTPTVTKVGKGGAEFQTGGGQTSIDKNLVERELPETLSSINALREKIADSQATLQLEQAKTLKDATEQQKTAAREAAAAARQATALLKQSDEESLSDIKANHAVGNAELRAYWTDRLAVEQSNSERSRDIKRTLGTLDQEFYKQTAEAASKAQKQQAEFSKKFFSGLEKDQKDYVDEEEKQWEASGRRTTDQIADKWRQIAALYGTNEALVKESIDKITASEKKGREETEKLADATAKLAEKKLDLAHASAEQAISSQYQLGTNKTQNPGLSSIASTLGASLSDKAQEDAALLAEDQKYFAQKLQLEQDNVNRVKALYGTETAEYTKALQQQAQVTQQANAKILQDQTKLTLDLKAQWQSFFNTFNSGFTSAINGAITGSKSFGAAFQEIYTQLVLQEIDYVALFLLKEAEKWAFSKLLAITGLATITAAQTSQAAVKSAANVAEAEGDAGLAAAGTFAWWSAVDPEVAPFAAAAAYAEGQVYAGLAAFEQGGYVPRTGVALLHQGEQVVNAPLTNLLTNVANNGGNSGHTFGDFHYHEGSSGAPSRGRAGASEMFDQFQKELRRRNLRYS